MFSEITALQFIASFLLNVLLYVETMSASREAKLNVQEALDFIFADEDSDEAGIIDEEEYCQFYCIYLSAKHCLVAVRTSFNFPAEFSKITSGHTYTSQDHWGKSARTYLIVVQHWKG